MHNPSTPATTTTTDSSTVNPAKVMRQDTLAIQDFFPVNIAAALRNVQISEMGDLLTDEHVRGICFEIDHGDVFKYLNSHFAGNLTAIQQIIQIFVQYSGITKAFDAFGNKQTTYNALQRASADSTDEEIEQLKQINHVYILTAMLYRTQKLLDKEINSANKQSLTELQQQLQTQLMHRDEEWLDDERIKQFIEQHKWNDLKDLIQNKNIDTAIKPAMIDKKSLIENGRFIDLLQDNNATRALIARFNYLNTYFHLEKAEQITHDHQNLHLPNVAHIYMLAISMLSREHRMTILDDLKNNNFSSAHFETAGKDSLVENIVAARDFFEFLHLTMIREIIFMKNKSHDVFNIERLEPDLFQARNKAVFFVSGMSVVSMLLGFSGFLTTNYNLIESRLGVSLFIVAISVGSIFLMTFLPAFAFYSLAPLIIQYLHRNPEKVAQDQIAHYLAKGIDTTARIREMVEMLAPPFEKVYNAPLKQDECEVTLPIEEEEHRQREIDEDGNLVVDRRDVDAVVNLGAFGGNNIQQPDENTNLLTGEQKKRCVVM